jgi:hypothetical protein
LIKIKLSRRVLEHHFHWTNKTMEGGMAYCHFHKSLKLVLAFMTVNCGAHSQTAQSPPPPSPIVVPRPDIEAVVQAMSTKTCAGIVTGKDKQAAAEANIKLLYKDKAIPYPLSADDVAQILAMMHCT